MYIWLVIATFIAVLYSFNLAFRPDMRQIVMDPKAEAVISRLIIKHKAAVKYVEDRTPPANGGTQITYTQGKLSVDTLASYVPYGFGALDGSNEHFKTVVYCVDKNAPTGETAIDCLDPAALKYIISYGCVPDKWRALGTGLPNADLQGAINRNASVGADFGYAKYWQSGDPSSIVTKMYIKGKKGVTTDIPDIIVTAKLGMEDSFNEVCGDGREENGCDVCLAYLSVYN